MINSKQEEWIYWKPLEGLARKYYVDSLSLTLAGFEIILSHFEEMESRLRIKFCSPLKAYRNIYETLRYKLILDLKEKYGNSFYGDWTFFQVLNSSYSDKLANLNNEKSEGKLLNHYVLITMDYIVEMISENIPLVEWIS